MYELGEILKKHNSCGRNVDIKMFSNINFRFQRITKANLKRLFSWETETTEELKKINLI
jgi:isocitrate dehydrogenase kinase/phosphatase